MSDPHPPHQPQQPGQDPWGSGQPAGDFPPQTPPNPAGYPPPPGAPPPPPGMPPYPPQQPGGWQPPPPPPPNKGNKVGWIIGGAALLVVVLLVGFVVVGAVLFSSNTESSSDDTQSSAGSQTPQADDGEHGVVVGAPEAETTVELASDFMCPACADFWASQGPTLESLALDGDIALVFHPVTFLDDESNGAEYSTRSAAAAVCASDEGEAEFFAYYTVLMQQQPEAGTDGHADGELVEMGVSEAGLSDDFAQCVESGTYHGWVQQASDEIVNDPEFAGTPSVRVDDEIVDDPGTTLPDVLSESDVD